MQSVRDERVLVYRFARRRCEGEQSQRCANASFSLGCSRCLSPQANRESRQGHSPVAKSFVEVTNRLQLRQAGSKEHAGSGGADVDRCAKQRDKHALLKHGACLGVLEHPRLTGGIGPQRPQAKHCLGGR
jgi:hypothetical protein